jgi:outer membrane protein assembly factor BamB
MCPAGESPVAAAYDADRGTFRWAACEPGTGHWIAEATTSDAVYVWNGSADPVQAVVALDAGDGSQQWRGSLERMEGELPDDADRPVREPPTEDGVSLAGGQDDPLTASDSATGERLWTQQAVLAYDDVWAVGDGAVFAVERDRQAIVAYELPSGEVRWDRADAASSWPWHVTGQRLLAMWHNLQVIDTGSGEVVWETTHPVPPTGFPRFSGGLANDDTIFVTFTTEPSGGD